MGTAIFLVLMVCGYWYTSRDLSSRLKIKRSSGWDVYFLVALYGCIFVLQGMLATAFIWLILLAISTFTDIGGLYAGPYGDLQSKFLNLSFMGIQAPVVIMLTFAIAFCLYRSSWAGSARLSAGNRKNLYRQLSRSNGTEQLLLQCMEQGELVWIMLRSRRVYVGMVHAATFEYQSTANIVVVPMLSGYRDAHTSDLIIENNYSRWYDRHDVSFVSKPKNALSFRKIIMLSQIESLSMFDPALARALAPESGIEE